MRWADLDMLGHVNNVVYVDYLQEARVDLIRTMLGERRDDLAEGVVVVRHEVTYLSPMPFSFTPVSIECWVTDIRAATFTLAYELFHEGPDGVRRTYARAVTVLTPYVFESEQPRRISPVERAALERYAEERLPGAPRIGKVDRERSFHYPLHVRFSDVDVYRHVNNVKYFEYLQESRVHLMSEITRTLDDQRPRMVVAQTDVDYRAPILLREQPYELWSQITRIGNRSMTLESEIADGDRTLARGRVTVVFFDTDTQRSAAPSDELRAALLATVPAAGPAGATGATAPR